MIANKTSLVIIINNKIKKQMSLEIGQTKSPLLQLNDSVTGQKVDSATFANNSVTSDNPSVATGAPIPNNDGAITITGVGAGTTNLHISTVCSYINSNGNQVTEAKSATIPVTVAAPPHATALSLQPAP